MTGTQLVGKITRYTYTVPTVAKLLNLSFYNSFPLLLFVFVSLFFFFLSLDFSYCILPFYLLCFPSAFFRFSFPLPSDSLSYTPSTAVRSFHTTTNNSNSPATQHQQLSLLLLPF